MTTQIAELLEKLKKERVYGTVSLQLKAGHLDLIRVETTIKPQIEGTTQHDNRNR
jgi:hypothetical protein